MDCDGLRQVRIILALSQSVKFTWLTSGNVSCQLRDVQKRVRILWEHLSCMFVYLHTHDTCRQLALRISQQPTASNSTEPSKNMPCVTLLNTPGANA